MISWIGRHRHSATLSEILMILVSVNRRKKNSLKSKNLVQAPGSCDTQYLPGPTPNSLFAYDCLACKPNRNRIKREEEEQRRRREQELSATLACLNDYTLKMKNSRWGMEKAAFILSILLSNDVKRSSAIQSRRQLPSQLQTNIFQLYLIFTSQPTYMLRSIVSIISASTWTASFTLKQCRSINVADITRF